MNLIKGKTTSSFKSKVSQIYNVNILNQGNEILISGYDGEVEIYDVRASKSSATAQITGKQIIYGAQLIPNAPQPYIMALKTGESVLLDHKLNIHSRQKISDYPLKSLTTDSDFVAFGDTHGHIHVYSQTPKNFENLEKEEDKENQNTDAKLETIKTSNKQSKNPLRLINSFKAHQQSVVSLASSSIKNVLVSGSRDGLVHFWDRNKDFEFEANGIGILDQVVCLDVCPKGDLVAAGSWDQNVCVFQV